MSCDYLYNTPIRRFSRSIEANFFLNILGSTISSIFAVVISLPFLLGFLLVLPACLSVRWLLLFIHCNRQRPRSGPGPESVRGNDSRWLGTEWRSSVIHAVLVFEAKKGVNVDHFRRLLLNRVIPLYPRLTQRLISLPLSAGVRNCWLIDPKFSIDNHVFSGPLFLANEKDLQDYVSKLVENGLPEDKPPWQLQVFRSFGINQDTVVILRIHQSVADGTALMKLLCHSLADSQGIEIPERPRFGFFDFCANVFRACFVGPLTVLLWLFLTGVDCNLLTHRSTWTGSVTVTWSASITLPKVIRIKQVTRSTVNCVMLSALAGALRRLLQGCGVKQPPDVKVVVPMDLRNQSFSTSVKTRLGNKTSSIIMPLPVAVEGCIPRLWATRKTLDSLKTSADPIILYVVTSALMSLGSASFARHLLNFLTEKASLQFSSLPGPTSKIFLEGQTLKGIYPILPAQANLGISITTITYADQIFVGVMAERALRPAAELILEYLEEQIEVLWKLLLNRRVPGERESTVNFTRTSISESPIKEITTRLNLVQKEVERLSDGKENGKDGKLNTLKAEFSELVNELKRRQSLNKGNDCDLLWKSSHKTFSSTSKRQITVSPKSNHQLHYFDFLIHETGEVKERIINKKHQIQNVNSINNVNLNFESTMKSNQKTKYNNSKPKDCVIIISENNTKFKLPMCHSIKSNSSNRNNDSSRINEYLEWDLKSKSELILNKPTKQIILTNSDCNKNKSKDNWRTIKLDEMHSVLDSKNSEETKSYKLEKENVKTSGLKIQSENMEPNDKKYDLSHKNYLDLVKLKNKHQIQIPCQIYGFKTDQNYESFDESEITGGVLI